LQTTSHVEDQKRRHAQLDAWFIDLDKKLWFIPFTQTSKARIALFSDIVVFIVREVPRCQDCLSVFLNPTTLVSFESIDAIWKKA